MNDPLIGEPLGPREFIMEQEEYKGYSTEYEFGWVWEITKDDEDYHKGGALSPSSAARNIKSMIGVFLRLGAMKNEDVEDSENLE